MSTDKPRKNIHVSGDVARGSAQPDMKDWAAIALTTVYDE
jgi:hypothetical protein